MKLLTKAVLKRLQPLGSTDGQGMDAIAQAKFFTPDSNWTFYATEFDGVDTFYGMIFGHEQEMDYASLAALQRARGPLRLPMERDLYFEPTKLSDITNPCR